MSEHRDLSDRPRAVDSAQNVTNAHWPLPAIAQTLRDVPTAEQIPVTARIVFDVDGEQFLPGDAVRWVPGRYVCVAVQDPRLLVPYVWLRPADVRRRVRGGGVAGS